MINWHQSEEITITFRIQTPWFDNELNELKQKVR